MDKKTTVFQSNYSILDNCLIFISMQVTCASQIWVLKLFAGAQLSNQFLIVHRRTWYKDYLTSGKRHI